MKILMVTPMPPQPQATGAIPLVLHAQLTGLAARHDITLVTVAGPDPAEWQAVSRLQARGIETLAVRRSNPSGLPRFRRAWRWASSWLRGKLPWRTIWFWEPEVQRILDRVLAERAYDLVTAEDNAMGIYHYRTLAPVVFTEHEVRRPRPVNWHPGPPTHWLRSAFREADWHRWQEYQRLIWRRFDRIQVFTPRDAEAVVNLAPDLSTRVRVNPFGIDLPASVNDNMEEKNNLLFVGNFTHPPNVDAALWLGREIMPALRARCPGVRLTLVGIYPPKPVRELACEDICVTGPVEEIEPYFERAAVFFAPVRIGGGMRMKVLQSMALGKAVVTTQRGADGLAIGGQEPPLAIAGTAGEMAEAAATLLGDAQTRRSLGNRARAFVAEYYSAQAYGRRLEVVYAEVTRNK
jgi:glycosyltransferase involved in cell wall biosynthesis